MIADKVYDAICIGCNQRIELHYYKEFVAGLFSNHHCKQIGTQIFKDPQADIVKEIRERV